MSKAVNAITIAYCNHNTPPLSLASKFANRPIRTQQIRFSSKQAFTSAHDRGNLTFPGEIWRIRELKTPRERKSAFTRNLENLRRGGGVCGVLVEIDSRPAGYKYEYMDTYIRSEFYDFQDYLPPYDLNTNTKHSL